MRRLAPPAAVGVLVAALVALVPPAPTAAHDERGPTPFTSAGAIPAYRATGAAVLVCGTDGADFARRIAAFPAALKARNAALWTQCQKSGRRTLQAAVNAVAQPGQTIQILPGVYVEEPSLATPSQWCANLPARTSAQGYQVLSWDQQNTCPNLQNLVAVLGKRNMQIEGTGAAATDVVLDARFRRLIAIRADRSPGLYVRNLTAEHTTSVAIDVTETDGFVLDHVVTRYTDEDGVLVWAGDHGLVTDCEAYGNGNAGLAVESTVDRGHSTVEIRRCVSQHNLMGFSGTGANSVSLHDSILRANSVGVRVDSLAAEHPLLPQNHARVEHNVIADNNADYYRFVRDGTCAKAADKRGYDTGVVCPLVGVPVGTGVVVAGGNDDSFRGNWVYGNTYAGFALWWVPGVERSDHRVSAQVDTGHRDRFVDNTLGRTRDGVPSPNRMDFWWDGQGTGSCWQSASAVGSTPRALPRCNADGVSAGPGIRRYLGEPGTTLQLYTCGRYDLASARVPGDCDWYGARGLARVEVRWALGEAVLLGLLLMLLWGRLLRGRRTRVARLGLLLGLAGLVVGVFGTLRPTSLLTPVGLALLGGGWIFIGVALRRRGRGGLGWLTIVLAVLALLGAFDRGVFPLPYVPFPPSVPRVLLEVVWVPWALVAALRGRVLAGTGRDPLERYTRSLRY